MQALNMSAVVWDPYIEAKAQAYSDLCDWEHSSSEYRQYKVSESIFVGHSELH